MEPVTAPTLPARQTAGVNIGWVAPSSCAPTEPCVPPSTLRPPGCPRRRPAAHRSQHPPLPTRTLREPHWHRPGVKCPPLRCVLTTRKEAGQQMRVAETSETDRGNLGLPDALKSHIVFLHVKPFIQYAGLLALAHERGLVSLKARFISVTAELALAEAEATFADGRTFAECADATPQNVGAKIKAHYARMALTRSKAR